MQAVLLSFVLFMCFFTSGKSQSCEKSSLKRLDNVDLSRLDSSYDYGKEVRLPCVDGYTGSHRATCRSGGWEFMRGGLCQKKQCGHPGDTPNGDFHLAMGDDFVFGSIVQYTCKTGYRMTSSHSELSCVNSGWDNDIPVCEVRKEDCFPPVIENGFIKQPFKDTVVFSCKRGFKLNTEGWWQKSTCSEGSWSSTPKCIAEHQCAAPRAADNVIYPHVKEIYSDGQFQEFKCEPGYTSDSGRIKCDNGQWEKPDCKRESGICNAPPDVEKGIIVPSSENIYRDEARETYTCHESYKMYGVDTITCNSGNWTDPPTCIVVEGFCGPPPVEELSDVVATSKQYYTHGERVKFQCQAGYILDSGSEKTCWYGKWIHPIRCRLRSG